MVYLAQISIIVMFTLVVSTNGAGPKNCQANMHHEADICFSKVLLYGDRTLKWGNNEQEVEKICKSVKNAEKCVRKYLKNCLSGLSNQVISLILKGAVNQVKKFCNNSKRQKEAITRSNCGNSNLEADHLCMESFVDRLKDASTLSDDDIRLSSSCCSFVQFENCIIKRMEEEKLCSKDDVQHFKTIVHAAAGDALDFSCADFNKDPSKCESINNKLKKVKKSEMKGKSILFPIVEIIKKI